MTETIRLLQAEIEADLLKIEETYYALKTMPPSKLREVSVGYYLNVLYGLFETMFVRIAEQFGNHIQDRARWHSELLRRMTLDVRPIRPPVIGQQSYQALNELRNFRHLFRNAYLLEFDTRRLALVWDFADQLQQTYPADFSQFRQFLQTLHEEKSAE